MSPIAGYLAIRFNRARLIASAELLLAFSCFLTASPYFIYGPAQLDEHHHNGNMTIGTNDNWLLNITQPTSTTPIPLIINGQSSIPIITTGKSPSIFKNLNNNHKSLQMCSDNNAGINEMRCLDKSSHTKWLAVVILFIVSFFKGIGFTCYFVIGFPYLDDNVGKKNSPIYMSIIQATRLIGPACGYLLSSFCLRFYENPLGKCFMIFEFFLSYSLFFL